MSLWAIEDGCNRFNYTFKMKCVAARLYYVFSRNNREPLDCFRAADPKAYHDHVYVHSSPDSGHRAARPGGEDQPLLHSHVALSLREPTPVIKLFQRMGRTVTTAACHNLNFK